MNKYGTNWGSQTCRFCPLPFHTGVQISNSQCVKKCEQLLQEWITGSNGDRPINEIGKPLRRHINFHNDEKQREEKKMKELIEEQISIAQRGSRLPMYGLLPFGQKPPKITEEAKKEEAKELLQMAERLIVLSKTMDGYKRWKPVKGKGGRYRQPL